MNPSVSSVSDLDLLVGKHISNLLMTYQINNFISLTNWIQIMNFPVTSANDKIF